MGREARGGGTGRLRKFAFAPCKNPFDERSLNGCSGLQYERCDGGSSHVDHQASLEAELGARASVESFFTTAPVLNPARSLMTGVVCGARVEDIKEQLMRELRYLDKLIDQLAMGKILRGSS